MHRQPRPEGLQLSSLDYQPSSPPPRDRVSMSPSYSLASAPSVNPDPAYIAASAAAQIITSDYRSHFSENTNNAASSNSHVAVVAPASLTLVNAFLDRLLYNFLASARSTSLASLRPAVQEVLKPRLAKEAITGADEEIEEFLGGGDEEELLTFHGGQEPTGDWDLDLVWRRTRLRCMVYTRLGDMEEEQEDMYITQEHLDDMGDERRLSRDLGNVSPAVAIFLTSILEFVGELALTIAGDAAYQRNEKVRSRGQRHPAQEIQVEEIDMEKVAFNTTLGRLWRSWRMLVRSPASSMSRRMSLDRPNLSGMRNFSHNGPIQESRYSGEDDPALPHSDQAAPSSGSDPESIPLPSTENDVAEIEVPGYAPLAERRLHISQGSVNRPHSMMGLMAFDNPMYSPMQPRPSSSEARATSPDGEYAMGRSRSHSLPRDEQSSSVQGDDLKQGDQADNMTTLSADAAPALRPRDMPVEQIITAKAIKDLWRDSPASLGPSSGGSAGSMPTTPLQGSVLNAISRHAARELSVSSSAASEMPMSKAEALDDAEMTREGLPEILSEKPQPDQYFGPGPRSIVRKGVPSMLDAGKADEGGVSPIIGAVSPLVGSVSPIGDGFPPSMDPSSFRSDDVSPIEDDDEDEEPEFIYSNSHEPLEEDEDEDEDENDFDTTTNEDYAIQSVPQQGYIPPTQSLAMDIPVAEPKPLNIRPRRVLTSDELAKSDKREAYVVDDASSQSGRNSDTSSLSGKDLQLDGTIANKRVRTGGAADGISPLTPLRESSETTHENFIEILPLQMSDRKNQPPGPHAPRSESLPSAYAHARDPSAPATTSRPADSRRQLLVLDTDPHSDRAGVQRLSPAEPLPREPTTPQGRRSESSARLMPAPVSGSSPVSQKLKGLVGWQPSGEDSTGTPRQSSDKSRGITVGNSSRPSDVGDERQRNFDQLIQSDQTIQYTLTPNVMRQIEGAESPRFVSQTKGRSAEPSPLPENLSDSRHNRSSSKPQAVMNGPGSNPARPSTNKIPRTSSNAANRDSLRPSFRISSGPPNKPEPKDPRGDDTSIRDFADFIRNTGPEQAKTLPKLPLSSGSTIAKQNSAGSDKKASSAGKLLSGKVGKSSTSAPVLNGKKSEIKAARKSATGARLQAREAAIKRSDQSSDLIDFIRQGPPADHAVGAHRIPRAVAPFRTTMDSDEIQALGHGKARDTSSFTSTQDSLLNSRSIQSSINSRTGLIDSPSRSTTKPTSNPSPIQPKPMRSSSPPLGQPQRKQRRVKDPYAIDSDSEDEMLATTPKPYRNDESLLDFLSNTAPPANNAPAPIVIRSAFDGVPENVTNGRTLQRKISGSSMRARFTRSGSIGHPGATSPNITAPRSPANPNGPQRSPTAPLQSTNTKPPNPRNASGSGRSNSQTISAFPRSTSPHLEPSPKSNRQEQYKPPGPSFAGHVERQRNVSAPAPTMGGGGPQVSGPGRPRQGPQPRTERLRDPTGGQESMRDLADFFANSGPPEGVTAPRARPESATGARDDKEGPGGGFSRMFSRRKKAGIV